MSMIPGEGEDLTRMDMSSGDVGGYMRGLGKMGRFEIPVLNNFSTADVITKYSRKGDYDILVMIPTHGSGDFYGTNYYDPEKKSQYVMKDNEEEKARNVHRPEEYKREVNALSNDMMRRGAATVYVHNSKTNVLSVYGVGFNMLGRADSIEVAKPETLQFYADSLWAAMSDKGSVVSGSYPMPELDTRIGNVTSTFRRMQHLKPIEIALDPYKKLFLGTDGYDIPKDIVGNPRSVSKMAGDAAGELCSDLFRESAFEK